MTSMEVRLNKQTETPVKTAATVATAATAGAAAGGGLKLASIAKDTFQSQIKGQKAFISAYPTAEEAQKYINAQRRKIANAETTDRIANTVDDIVGVHNSKTFKTEELKQAATEKYERYKQAHKDLVQKGTIKASKEVDEAEKLLTSGKTSKTKALKDTVKELGGKASDKLSGLKESLGENLKEAKGVKGKFKAVKDSLVKFYKETPSIKKAGKWALVGAAVSGAAALVIKAVSEKNKKEA